MMYSGLIQNKEKGENIISTDQNINMDQNKLERVF